MKPVYRERALSIDEIIDMLERQGLTVEDRDRAHHVLENVSYSRLRSYLVPLMTNRYSHQFKPGTTFEMSYALYGFDRRLRELVFHEMEKIEISIRTHIAYASNGSEGGYWFTNPEHFRNKSSHGYLLRKIKSDVEHSDNDAIVEFRQKYSNEFPPCWLTLEATSMGTLSVIYEEMEAGEIKSRIASYYGLDVVTFNSWLKHMVYIRNYCAHHNRLWNKHLTHRAVLPALDRRGCVVGPGRKLFANVDEKSVGTVYLTLCIIKFLQNTVKPENTFARRVRSLIDNFPVIDPSLMGFPAGWKEDPFWK